MKTLLKLIDLSHNLYSLKKYFVYLCTFVTYVIAKGKKVKLVLLFGMLVI